MVWAMTSRSFLVAAVWCLSGCASVSTMGLARTLNKGAAQGWVGPSGGGVIALPASPGGRGGTLGYPLIEGGGRFGITDHFELGGRIGFSGIGLEGKVALVRPPTMDSGVNVSLNPGALFVGFGGGDLFVGTLTFNLPVLIGIDFSGHELVLGPKLIDQIVFGGFAANGAILNILYGGGSVGFAVKIAPNFRMIPEVSVGVPFFAAGSNTAGQSAQALGAGGLIFQAGLGFVFGGADQYDKVELRPPPPPPLVPASPPPPPPPPNAL